MSEQYKQAGVDINAGYEAVEQMKDHVKRTMRPEVIGGLGGFGAAFDLSQLNMKAPVLVSGTDGVGTKLKLAIDNNRHDTIGVDAVAMCVNDIITTGAEPLYFLDYIAVNKVVPEHIGEIVKGIAEGCSQSECALLAEKQLKWARCTAAVSTILQDLLSVLLKRMNILTAVLFKQAIKLSDSLQAVSIQTATA